MEELGDLDFGGEVSDWCPGCRQLRQELEKTKNDNVLSCRMLKDKIISTDGLIKKYTSKCKECELQSKRIEEMGKKLLSYQRECDELTDRLKTALQEVEPLRKYKTRTEKEVKSREKKLEDVSSRVKGLESHCLQLSTCLAQKDGEIEQLMTSKAAVEEKLASQVAEMKKANEKMEKNKDLHTELASIKETNSNIRKTNRKLESKLERYEAVLKKQGLLTVSGKLKGLRHPCQNTGPLVPSSESALQAKAADRAGNPAPVESHIGSELSDVECKPVDLSTPLGRYFGRSHALKSVADVHSSNATASTSAAKSVETGSLLGGATVESEISSTESDDEDDVEKIFAAVGLESGKSAAAPKKSSGFASTFLRPISPALSPLPHSPAPRSDSSSSDDASLGDVIEEVNAQLLRRSPRRMTPSSAHGEVKVKKLPIKDKLKSPTGLGLAPRGRRKPRPLPQDDTFLVRRHSRTPLVAAHKAAPSGGKAAHDKAQLPPESAIDKSETAECLSDSSDTDHRAPGPFPAGQDSDEVTSQAAVGQGEGASESGGAGAAGVPATRRQSRRLSKQDTGSFDIQDGGSLDILDGGSLAIQDGGSLDIQVGGSLDNQGGISLDVQDRNVFDGDTKGKENISCDKGSENDRENHLAVQQPEASEEIPNAKNSNSEQNNSVSGSGTEIHSNCEGNNDDIHAGSEGKKSQSENNGTHLDDVVADLAVSSSEDEAVRKSPRPSPRILRHQLHRAEESPDLKISVLGSTATQSVPKIDQGELVTGQSEPKSGQGEPLMSPSEPKSGQDEPLTNQSEPKSGQSEPLTGQSEPKSGQGEPLTGQNEPKSGQVEPMMGPSEPKSGQGESLTGQSEPKSGQGEPLTGQNEPETGQGEPLTVQSETKSGQGESLTGESEPRASQLEPTTSQRGTRASQNARRTGASVTNADVVTSPVKSHLSHTDVSGHGNDVTLTQTNQICCENASLESNPIGASSCEKHDTEIVEAATSVENHSDLQGANGDLDLKSTAGTSAETSKPENNSGDSAKVAPARVATESSQTRRRTRSSVRSTLSESSESESEQSLAGELRRRISDVGNETHRIVTRRRTRFQTGYGGEKIADRVPGIETRSPETNESSRKFPTRQRHDRLLSDSRTEQEEQTFKEPLPVGDNQGSNDMCSRRRTRCTSSPGNLDDVTKSTAKTPTSETRETASVLKNTISEFIQGTDSQKGEKKAKISKQYSLEHCEGQSASESVHTVSGSTAPALLDQENVESHDPGGNNNADSNSGGDVTEVVTGKDADSESSVLDSPVPSVESVSDFSAMSPIGRLGPKVLPDILSPLPPTPVRSTSRDSAASQDSLAPERGVASENEGVTSQLCAEGLEAGSKRNSPEGGALPVSGSPNSVDTPKNASSDRPVSPKQNPYADKSSAHLVLPAPAVILDDVAMGAISPQKGAIHFLHGNSKSVSRTLTMVQNNSSNKSKQNGGNVSGCSQNSSGVTALHPDKKIPTGSKNEDVQSGVRNVEECMKNAQKTRKDEEECMENAQKTRKDEEECMENAQKTRKDEEECMKNAQKTRKDPGQPTDTAKSEGHSTVVKPGEQTGRGVCESNKSNKKPSIASDLDLPANFHDPRPVTRRVAHKPHEGSFNPEQQKSISRACSVSATSEKIAAKFQANKRTVQLIDFVPEVKPVKSKRGRKAKANTEVGGVGENAEVKPEVLDVKPISSVIDKNNCESNQQNGSAAATKSNRKATKGRGKKQNSNNSNQPMGDSVTSQGRIGNLQSEKPVSDVIGSHSEPMKCEVTGEDEKPQLRLDDSVSQATSTVKTVRKRKSQDFDESGLDGASQTKIAKIQPEGTLTLTAAQTRNVDRELQFVLRFKSVKIEDIALRLCKITPRVPLLGLTERILQVAGSVTKDLLPEAYRMCNDLDCCMPGTWQPLVTEEERRLSELIMQLESKQLMEGLVDAFLTQATSGVVRSDSMHVLGKCAISRLVASLCKHSNHASRLRCFLYDVVHHDVIGAPSIFGACAMAWPEALARESNEVTQPMMSVFEHVILSLPSDGQSPSPKLEQLIVFLTTLCNWSMPTRDSRDLMLDLIQTLENMDQDESLRGRHYECEKALELVLGREAWRWVHSNFVCGAALPRLTMWLKGPDKFVCMASTLLRLLGTMCRRYPPSERQKVDSIIEFLTQFCTGESCSRFSKEVQFKALGSILLLAPFCVTKSTGICQKWAHSNKACLSGLEKQTVREFLVHYKRDLPYLDTDF